MRRLAVIAACCLALCLAATPAYARVVTRLKASISKATCTYDSPAVFKATLADSEGKRLAGKKVVLERDGSRVGTSTTNSAGIVSRKVKFLGTARWRWVFAGDGDSLGSTSAAKTTKASIVRHRTYTAVRNEDGTYYVHVTFKLTKRHTYSLAVDHPALYYLGSVANYEHANQIAKDTSGTKSRFTFKAPRSARYWAEWDWSDALNGVSDTSIDVVIW